MPKNQMKELQIIQSKLKAPKGQTNKFGGYKYRNAEDILEALKPLLEEQNAVITLSDKMIQLGDRYYVEATATITCPSGEVSVTAYAREALTKKGMDEAQITGSASSYARKYAMNGLLAIDDTKDADAQEDPSPPTPAPNKAAPPVNTEHVGRGPDDSPKAEPQQLENLQTLAKKLGATPAQMKKAIEKLGTGKTKSSELNKSEAAVIIGNMTKALEKKK